MKPVLDIKEAIRNLKVQIAQADRYFEEWYMIDDEYKEPSWLIEVCFFHLLAITEALELHELRKMILADTRGYTSKDWNRFLYVIYETNRFRTEKDWNQFLEQSGITKNTTVVVLSGEPVPQPNAKISKKPAIRKTKKQ